MLFHIEQVHQPQDCPYGNGGSRSLHDASVEGVEVRAVYGAFMEHTVFLVVEADDLEKVNAFLLPGHEDVHRAHPPVSETPMPV